MIEAFGGALAAPSANRSGRLSPTRAEHVIEQLGDSVALVLDAGPCAVGLESTILSLAGDRAKLLRPGGVPAEAIEAALGETPRTRVGRRSGHRSRHARQPLRAAPAAPARRKLGRARRGAPRFRTRHIPGAERAVATRNLSPAGDLVEAAANLFAFLAELDRSRAAAIAVAPIPQQGLGEAINDRLERAAAPRPPDR